jgi:pimeloyl-ACP methyl ester carboxylesterase
MIRISRTSEGYGMQALESGVQLERRMIETNGVTLHVVQAGPEDGELVILLHGFPEFWYGWHKHIPALARAGFRVWAVDQRGYNLSEKPKGVEAYRLRALTDDIAGLVAASGRSQVYLVGHDWGALVAWTVAIRYPKLLRKLIILNVPHPGVFRQMLRTNPQQMMRSIYAGFFQLPILPESLLMFGDGMGAARVLISTAKPGTFTDADIAQYTRAWQQPNAMTSMLNWYRAAVQYSQDMPGLERVSVPTLMIWGAQDPALVRANAQPSIDLCDNGRLVFFEDATHWVQHEKTDDVNRLMVEFLRQ